ncbi:hypothetical protein ACEWY4_020655 [Coilia grayii]|uniref:Androgen-dependent TFPI-regulating protein n=1 Tax=Coilia grayii TaxID=363190 RepID=A0ABD1J6Q3_9TELE
MSGVAQKIFHLAAFSWYAFVINALYAKGNEELPPGIFPYGGPWKYLTFLNLVGFTVQYNYIDPECVDFQILQMVFFGLAALDDVQSSGKYLRVAKDLLFSIYVFPVGMHTFVFPILMGEIMLQPHAYPKTKTGMTALGGVGLAYLSWVIWVYLSVGIWVYPLLSLLSPAGLVALFFVNMTMVTLLYLLGQRLNDCIWGKFYITLALACPQ